MIADQHDSGKEVTAVMRFFTVFLCALMISGPQSKNPARKPVAITVEITGQQDVQRLLGGLEKTDARVTFFLGDGEIEPAQARKIAEGGHEMALTVHSRESGALLSRRNLAAQIVDARAVMPRGVKPHWLRLEEGLTDGSRQVARVKNLAILGENEDVLDLGRASVDEVLLTVSRLHGQGYEIVTVSELARLNRVKVRPGKVYEGF